MQYGLASSPSLAAPHSIHGMAMWYICAMNGVKALRNQKPEVGIKAKGSEKVVEFSRWFMFNIMKVDYKRIRFLVMCAVCSTKKPIIKLESSGVSPYIVYLFPTNTPTHKQTQFKKIPTIFHQNHLNGFVLVAAVVICLNELNSIYLCVYGICIGYTTHTHTHYKTIYSFHLAK